MTQCGSPDKPSILHALGVGVALLDYDGDGDLDLFVGPGSKVEGGKVAPAGGPWLFRNDGPGRWSDQTRASGLAWTGWAQAVSVADYDADGDPDLLVLQHGPDTLWRNNGDGTFRDVTAGSGISDPLWSVAASWGDVDGDGRPDLYIGNYVEVDAIHPPPLHDHLGGVKVFQGPGMLPGQPDRLLRNRGDGTFEDITASSDVSRPDSKAMATVCADLDGDGLLDIYVTNDAQANELVPGPGQAGSSARSGLRRARRMGPLGGPEGSMGVEVGDVDGDGRFDLVHSNFRHEGTRVLLGRERGFYQDFSNGSRVGNFTVGVVGWGLVLADFDHDGDLDLFQVNGHFYPNTPDSRYDQPPLLLKNLGKGAFEDATAVSGPDLDAMRSGRSVACGDLDGDGDLDLVMTTIDGPLRVLINEARRAGHALAIRLVGKHPNLEAIGAKVEVESNGKAQIRQIHRGGGFMGASDVTLHFGLGSAEKADRVVVTWPDGSKERHENIRADARVTIRQGAPIAVAQFPDPLHKTGALP